MPESKPKIVVVGIGSIFFGRQVISKMVQSKVLRNGTLALVDTNEKALKKMEQLARLAAEEANAPTVIEASTNHHDVLKNADFVILAFADRGVHFRGVDCNTSQKHGVHMCSGDTIGPGGIFRSLREIPSALAIARDVEHMAPQAWIINYINPTAVLGIALMRHAKVKSFALCDGHHEPHFRREMLRMVGLLGPDKTNARLERDTDLAVAGVNHCTWIIRFRKGRKDYLPALREHTAKLAAREKRSPYAKENFREKYRLALVDIYGAYPTAIGHTQEYVPFFQGYGVSKNILSPVSVFDAKQRQNHVDTIWAETNEYLTGKKPMSEFLKTVPSDHATDIIESMYGNLKKPFFINGPNHGAVTNLPDDAFIELRSDINMKRFKRQPVGDMPRGLLSLTQQILDTHELTVEAAITGDRKLLRRALLTDPIVNNIGDAGAIMKKLLRRERSALPDYWY